MDGKNIIGVLDNDTTSPAVTRSFVTTLQGEEHLFSIQKMTKPFKYKLANGVLDKNSKATGETENEDLEITELCRLSHEWTLPLRPLCMRDTNFLIMEAFMKEEEFIIGLPELKKMGLDPVRIIYEVRDSFHTTDFSDCGPTAVFEKSAKMGRFLPCGRPVELSMIGKLCSCDISQCMRTSRSPNASGSVKIFKRSSCSPRSGLRCPRAPFKNRRPSQPQITARKGVYLLLLLAPKRRRRR
jgi:hypothetical protein